jgi:hypothetical protein
MMNRNKKIIIIAVISVVGVATLSIGNGCSQQYANFGSSNGNSAAGVGPGGSNPSTDVTVIPGARTVSLAYSKQVLDQLSSCAGLAAPSDKTIAMYQQKQGAISMYGYVNTVTSPMLMAETSIAGEICNDLINQEMTSGPRLFIGYNFAANTVPDANMLGDSISRIALSCWQRNETSTERQLILDMIGSSVGAAEATASKKSALMICTAMLSSLDAMLN